MCLCGVHFFYYKTYHITPNMVFDYESSDYTKEIWFIYYGHELLPIRLTQQTLCCIRKFTMKHLKKLDLPCFSYGYRKCKFVHFLYEYIGPSNYAQY